MLEDGREDLHNALESERSWVRLGLQLTSLGVVHQVRNAQRLARLVRKEDLKLLRRLELRGVLHSLLKSLLNDIEHGAEKKGTESQRELCVLLSLELVPMFAFLGQEGNDAHS